MTVSPNQIIIIIIIKFPLKLLYNVLEVWGDLYCLMSCTKRFFNRKTNGNKTMKPKCKIKVRDSNHDRTR